MIYYEATITEIGEEALSEENLIVLFKDNAPQDLRPYCILHNGDSVQESIISGVSLTLGVHSYKIVAVGNLVSKTLHELGHITIYFKEDQAPANPGDINVIGIKPVLTVGDKILIQG